MQRWNTEAGTGWKDDNGPWVAWEDVQKEFIQQDPYGEEARATVIWHGDLQVTQKMWDSLLAENEKLRSENERLRERNTEQANRIRQDPALLLSCVRDIIKEPLTCGHPLECWDEPEGSQECAWCRDKAQLSAATARAEKAERDADRLRKDLCEIAKGCGVGCPDEEEAKRRIIAIASERDEARANLGMANDALCTARQAMGSDDMPFLDDGIRKLRANLSSATRERDEARAQLAETTQHALRAVKECDEAREEHRKLYDRTVSIAVYKEKIALCNKLYDQRDTAREQARELAKALAHMTGTESKYGKLARDFLAAEPAQPEGEKCPNCCGSGKLPGRPGEELTCYGCMGTGRATKPERKKAERYYLAIGHPGDVATAAEIRDAKTSGSGR